MRLAIWLDGAGGGNQRLPEHLAAENPLPTIFGTATAEEVVLERLQVEDAEQVFDRSRHSVLAGSRAEAVRNLGSRGGEVKQGLTHG
jgi:hypothetical protein